MKVIFVFLASFALYLYHLSPATPPRDSAELIAASTTLGIPHPPGYPLYITTGKLFSCAIPFGNPSYRLNVHAAFFSALTVMLTFLCVRLILQKDWTALLVSGTLALSKTFFIQSLQAEVFSLNSVFLCAILLAALLNRTNLSLFLFGLGFGNHQTLIFLFPVFFRKIKWQAIFLFALGFSIYLFLPVRAAKNPELNWGNPDSPKRFFEVISRREYGSFALASDSMPFHPQTAASGILNHLKSLSRDMTPLGLIPLAVGLLQAPLPFVLIFVLSGPFFVALAGLPHTVEMLAVVERFYIFPLILSSLLVAFGLRRFPKLAFVLVISFALNGILHHHLSQRQNLLAQDLTTNALRSVKPAGLLFVSGDTPAFLLWNARAAFHKRRDVRVLPEVWISDWGIRKLKSLYPGLIPKEKARYKRQEFVSEILRKNLEGGIFLFGDPGIKPFPFSRSVIGIVDFVGRPAPISAWDFYALRGFVLSGDWFSDEIIRQYAAARHRLAIEILGLGRFREAAREASQSLNIYPNSSETENTLGSALFSEGDFEKALAHFRKAIALKPANAEAHSNSGAALASLHRWQEALSAFDEALRLQPKMEVVRHQREIVLQGLRKQ